mmetsp:Transcript_43117/g.135189  ORF Transcript_43117/g.135189 Transcript_43117/m.135189 type:complete len:294 (-) Transcript_43117:22-903(-)
MSYHRSQSRDSLGGRLFYCSLYIVLAAYGVISIIAPWVVGPCVNVPSGKTYSNPDYAYDGDCARVRYWRLLLLTPFEADMIQRQLVSGILGAVIGWERRIIDKPAGIRTMSLVSIGACLFTLCSMFSFLSGSMEWDASRVSAAIPSGVGFLGAGLIWKGTVNNAGQVHGLTTAASVWLSAAVGVACGGHLYAVALFAVVLIILILRGFPRVLGEVGGGILKDGDSDIDDEESFLIGDVESTVPPLGSQFSGHYGAVNASHNPNPYSDPNPNPNLSSGKPKSRKSLSSRPSFHA